MATISGFVFEGGGTGSVGFFTTGAAGLTATTLTGAFAAGAALAGSFFVGAGLEEVGLEEVIATELSGFLETTFFGDASFVGFVAAFAPFLAETLFAEPVLAVATPLVEAVFLADEIFELAKPFTGFAVAALDVALLTADFAVPVFDGDFGAVDTVTVGFLAPLAATFFAVVFFTAFAATVFGDAALLAVPVFDDFAALGALFALGLAAFSADADLELA